ncbi:MAG: TonB-dependent receptor [Halieaceae bacterium]|nr:TonB-dependent receptor [Halieaceae bacterium]
MHAKFHALPCLLTLLAVAPAAAEPPALEHITVRAREARGAWTNVDSLLTAPLSPREQAAPVLSLADLAQLQPSIALSGQGGLLQTVSIRGISGQQVANFWSNLPILSDRRAGTASSFIDPVMLGSLEVLRGPASVYYGNGAGGGVLQLAPYRPKGIEAQLLWGSEGDENLQYLGAGNESRTFAVSRRGADDSETADGDSLNSEFEQYNLQVTGRFELAGREAEFEQLFSEGRDIGKSNSREPARPTDYPEERHWLGELSVELAEGWNASIYYHYQELDTRVERPGERINDVESESLDWGTRLVNQRSLGLTDFNWGLEYFGRRNVESRERETSLVTGDVLRQQTLDAEQDGVDLFADVYRQLGDVSLAAGLRWAWQDQQAEGQPSEDDSALSGFLRADWQAGEQWLLSLELARGTRFAGVSERFFSGTTGRGQLLGNPALDPEDTLGVDLGLQWRGERAQFEIHAYGMRIDDYIERVDISEELQTFLNLTEGEIIGLEAAGSIVLRDGWNLDLGGHWLDAEDDDGNPLTDAVAPSAFAALRIAQGPWRAGLRYEYRFSENDVAPGEERLDSASMLRASLGRDLGRGLRLELWGRNLLDASFRLGSDRLATEAPERSLGITLAWQQAPRQAR